ncbi:DegT/DnrJ/EryC1/StrS family aminotransferase [Cytobacillus praedii]|uniref:DegT/DnrJ/EryC1/StrS family aminotransferase n=1 Tax=Cytobacillus praedii TaxID=1742358 RepID=UPI003F7D8CF2
MHVNLYKPFIEDEEINAVTRVMKRKRIEKGPVVDLFEQEFADFFNAKHAIAVNSCTSALHLALDSFGIGPGDEVITTALTYCATAYAIMYTGATPVLADIDPSTLCISLDSVRKNITSKTKAIIPVHYSGYPCDMDGLADICREHNLVLIEDAAHALPSRINGKLIGEQRNGIKGATCFSFHASKNLAVGDGGMIVTNDSIAASIMKSKRLFGMAKKDTDSILFKYDVITFGYKYNMTDIEAAIGRVQLKKIDTMLELRKKAVDYYIENLKELPNVILPSEPINGNSSWQLFPIRVMGGLRDNLLKKLREKSIESLIHFIPIHMIPFFSGKVKYGNLDVSESVVDQLISLPLYPNITTSDLDYVIDVVKDVLKK